jgi:hypothetical protein
MRFLIGLLLALTMTFDVYASTVQWEKCCPDADCAMMDCVQMGCLPAVMPALPPSQAALPASVQVLHASPMPQSFLPNRYSEIWIPPD